MPKLQYRSDYDATFILLPPTSMKSVSTVEISCAVSHCTVNQYKSNGQCVQCPTSKPRSSPGSLSIEDCVKCPSGTDLPHPFASVCTLSQNFLRISRSNGWRIWAPEYHVVSHSRWGVRKLEFYSSNDCTGSKVNPNGEAIHSNSYKGTSPSFAEPAFADTGAWAGKQDEDGVFWIGMIFSEEILVQCVKVVNSKFSVREIRVQALVGSEGWKNVFIQKDLDLRKGVELILSFDYPLTQTPSTSPSITPTIAPSTTPTESPSSTLSTAPTVAPSIVPTESPSITPSTTFSIAPSNIQSAVPSFMPLTTPSVIPSIMPSQSPFSTPSILPSAAPSFIPLAKPSAAPSLIPSTIPSAAPLVLSCYQITYPDATTDIEVH